jgi:hypothetical protein
MDAVEEVGEIGLWIEAVKLCGFDDRHGTRKSFLACAGPVKSQFFFRCRSGGQVISDMTPCMTH